MKITARDWPVLLISSEIDQSTDNGFRLREIAEKLTEVQQCQVIVSKTYEDALELFLARADLGAVLIDWELPEDDGTEKMMPEELVRLIRMRNDKLPILLLTDRLETEDLEADTLRRINGCLWKNADTADFLAGRIAVHLLEYVGSVYPGFFGKLVRYSEQYKYAWHTPGHLGGQGFLRSPAGVAMFKFYGENTFRSDLSISVPELGSLLDHDGAAGDAEKNSARVFGADQTYYVLNGTSTVNQIIWRSQVSDGDIALVDRNCHKSLNYAMAITGAIPVYMIPRRNARGIIGPVALSEFTPDSIREKIGASSLIGPDSTRNHPRMSALTNSTYDGICYNVSQIKKQLKKSVDNLHFDEAWYAYARFNPIYDKHYGMTSEAVLPDDPPIFCSQSTHKLLTAFSQASMLHIRNGGKRAIDPVVFNESFMMHGSTSPQYSMIASLDVATKMMDDQGAMLTDDIIREAVQLRRKVASLRRELAKNNDWFFGMWQPETVECGDAVRPFADMDTDELAHHQKYWVLSARNNWHGFADIEPDYVMLDPIKLTVTTPGLDDAGEFGAWGIPAVIVTNYLIKHNIVCEKTDYYSFLLLNSLGTTRAKQGTLLAGLFRFKEAYDRDDALEKVFPELVAAHPDRYAGQTLREHCQSMHEAIVKSRLLTLMHRAFEVIPDQALKPADAFRMIVRGEVEQVELEAMKNRVTAVMLVPYPPGIPIAMGGEILNDRAEPILDYLLARQEFENRFPGYESDIHGIERKRIHGKTVFRTLAVKQGAVR